MAQFAFQKLEVYQLSKLLVIKTYGITQKFPSHEKFALGQQMNRAAVSVPSNIAEGYARNSNKDKCHFLNISYGSLMELVCQFEIATELNYITKEEFNTVESEANILAIKISNFKKYLANK